MVHVTLLRVKRVKKRLCQKLQGINEVWDISRMCGAETKFTITKSIPYLWLMSQKPLTKGERAQKEQGKKAIEWLSYQQSLKHEAEQ